MQKTTSTSPLVQAEHLGKNFPGGVQAVADVALSIGEGEFISLVGPSGCGKSTLLRLVAGLEPFTEGQLQVAGLSPSAARRQRGDLSYVFQDATLLEWRTVEKNVSLPLELMRSHSSGIPVDQALSMVGLTDFATAYPWQLSGGMRMRVSIARALVTRPGLLLMDEPFGALDEITRQRLNEELLHLWHRDRWTCVFVTHNVYEAVFMSQRVLVMSARPGRILADIPVPLPAERSADLRTDPEFNRIAAQVSTQLQQTYS